MTPHNVVSARGLRRLARALRCAATTSLFMLPVFAACGAPTVAVTPASPMPTPRPEALSLLGQPLYAPELPPDVRTLREQQLRDAYAAYHRDSTNADSIIWLGRRLAYMGEYRDAINVFTRGIALHPRDARLYRHRGHRFITTRQFVRAIDDLETAADLVRGTPDQVEPDGLPNAHGIPVSTLHTNILYHLALAYYLRHDFERALPVWRAAVEAAPNDDMLVAGTDWLYMTLRRLGRDEEAAAVLQPIREDMRILENHAYHRRLLMYRGELSPDSLMPAGTSDPVQLATYGYGVANWYFYNGDRSTANALFRRIIEGPNWAAFGYIAAEAELAARRP